MDKMQDGQSPIDTNNYRLLSLYTDIRFYDNEIRQVPKTKTSHYKKKTKE